MVTENDSAKDNIILKLKYVKMLIIIFLNVKNSEH